MLQEKTCLTLEVRLHLVNSGIIVSFRTVTLRPSWTKEERWPVPFLRDSATFLTPLKRLSLARNKCITLIVNLVAFVTLIIDSLLVGHIPLTLCRVTTPFTAVCWLLVTIILRRKWYEMTAALRGVLTAVLLFMDSTKEGLRAARKLKNDEFGCTKRVGSLEVRAIGCFLV